jgi:hypothetical protein
MFYGYKNGTLVCTLQDSAVTTRQGMLVNGTADTFTSAPPSEPGPAAAPSAAPVLFSSQTDNSETVNGLTDTGTAADNSTVYEAPPVKRQGKGKR